MQASGHRFDPDKLHHFVQVRRISGEYRSDGSSQRFPGMKSSGLPDLSGDMARNACLFDIVNGFFNRCRGDMGLVFVRLPRGERMKVSSVLYTQDYLAEY